MIARREGLLLGAAIVAISTAAVLIRGASEAPAIVIAAYRLLFGSILIALPAVRPERRRALLAQRGRALGVAILAGCFLAAHFATWITSLRLTNVASSIALVTAHPLFVALGSRWLLGERIARTTGIGIGVGLLGIAWLATLDRARGAAESLAGDALAFAGCLFAAMYFLCGRWARGRSSLWSYVTVAYATAALLLLLGVLVTGASMVGYSGVSYLCFVLLALVPQGVGHTLINRALRHMGAPIVSLAILGEVPGATLLAWLLLGEGVPPMRLVAVAVIVLAVALAILAAERTRRDAVP
jgi:drug/metabolite transporter (DMT)-like permease